MLLGAHFAHINRVPCQLASLSNIHIDFDGYQYGGISSSLVRGVIN